MYSCFVNSSLYAVALPGGTAGQFCKNSNTLKHVKELKANYWRWPTHQPPTVGHTQANGEHRGNDPMCPFVCFILVQSESLLLLMHFRQTVKSVPLTLKVHATVHICFEWNSGICIMIKKTCQSSYILISILFWNLLTLKHII